jgi:hypothetical protein
MSRTSIARRPLQVENLESRAMLAVNVSVSGGALKVNGSNADDQIAIVQLDRNEFAVVGLNGTLVNGTPDGIAVRDRVKYDIRVDLKGGNDAVFVGNDVDALIAIAEDYGLDVPPLPDAGDLPGTGFTAPDDLVIKTGIGDDVVAVIARVKDGLDINTDRGFDLVAVRNTSVGTYAKIDTGSDADFLELTDFSVRKHLSVKLGSGDDNYFFDNVDVFDDADFNAGSGNDGQTTGLIQNSFIKDSFKASLGSGDDNITFLNNAGKSSLVDGESGFDQLFFDNDLLNDFRHYKLKSITPVEVDID